MVAVDVPYRPDAASFRELLPRIQASAPDAIFVPGYHSDAARFAVDARAAGIAVPLLGTYGWDAPALLSRPIAEFAALFGLPMFRERSAPDYLQRLPALRQERMAAAERFAKGSPFWAARP